MEKALEKVPEKARQRLQKRMPPAGPFTFTHGDLTNVNIIVKDGHLAGIIDWEVSGFYPVWWEFTCRNWFKRRRLGMEDSSAEEYSRLHGGIRILDGLPFTLPISNVRRCRTDVIGGIAPGLRLLLQG